MKRLLCAALILVAPVWAQFSVSTRLDASADFSLAPGLSLSLSGRLDTSLGPSPTTVSATLRPSLRYSITLIDQDPFKLHAYADLNSSLKTGLLNTTGSADASGDVGLDMGYQLAEGLNLDGTLEADSDLFTLDNSGFVSDIRVIIKINLNLVYSLDPLNVSVGGRLGISPPSSDDLFEEPDPDIEPPRPPPTATYDVNLYISTDYDLDSTQSFRVRAETTLDDFTLSAGANYKLDAKSSVDLEMKLESKDFGIQLKYRGESFNASASVEVDKPPANPFSYTLKADYDLSKDLNLSVRLDGPDGLRFKTELQYDLDRQSSLDLEATIESGKLGLDFTYRIRF